MRCLAITQWGEMSDREARHSMRVIVTGEGVTTSALKLVAKAVCSGNGGPSSLHEESIFRGGILHSHSLEGGDAEAQSGHCAVQRDMLAIEGRGSLVIQVLGEIDFVLGNVVR
jgi:hypothetical protein